MPSSLVNIGCGHTWHPAWTNLDLRPVSAEVRPWDLNDGLPFKAGGIDACYASHILEHFTRIQARALIQESFRVLRPGGIIRVAVPDLEAIAREYLELLARADKGDETAIGRYEWITLELLDQLVRDKSGGEMEQYLRSRARDQAEYVVSRIGPEAMSYMQREADMEPRSMNRAALPENARSAKTVTRVIASMIRPMLAGASQMRMRLCNVLGGRGTGDAACEGMFRRSGECHKWMYDRFSLRQLLEGCGFAEVRICTAFESRIAGFASFGLDVVNGKIRKPDSLFMEAVKPR